MALFLLLWPLSCDLPLWGLLTGLLWIVSKPKCAIAGYTLPLPYFNQVRYNTHPIASGLGKMMLVHIILNRLFPQNHCAQPTVLLLFALIMGTRLTASDLAIQQFVDRHSTDNPLPTATL